MVVEAMMVPFSLVQFVENRGVPQGEINVLVRPKFLYKIYVEIDGLRREVFNHIGGEP